MHTYIVAEIGINHQHDTEILMKLIKVAADAGCDAVKFQTRTPELQVPRERWGVIRDSPWGELSTIEYRRRIELTDEDYHRISVETERLGLDWFSSAWDVPSVERLERLPRFKWHKVPSAMLTNDDLLQAIAATKRGTMISTGMSTLLEVQHAVEMLWPGTIPAILACTSDYPTKDGEINLATIQTLQDEFPGHRIGYSGHEIGILPSVLAVARYGASIVERHITLDRGMPGSDHGASLEPKGITTLVRDIRRAEALLECDGVKRITEGERKQIERLRNATNRIDTEARRHPSRSPTSSGAVAGVSHASGSTSKPGATNEASPDAHPTSGSFCVDGGWQSHDHRRRGCA